MKNPLCNFIYSFTDSLKKELKPNALPSQNITSENNSKKIFINKCGICNEIIDAKRYAFGLTSAGNQATKNKWIKILGGKKFIKSGLRICYIHFKPSDFLTSKFFFDFF